MFSAVYLREFLNKVIRNLMYLPSVVHIMTH